MHGGCAVPWRVQQPKKAHVMHHRVAPFKQDDTVVHEQGGEGWSHAQDKADLLFLIKTNGHRKHQSRNLPKPRTDEHIVPR
jgi:hypothetical protein